MSHFANIRVKTCTNHLFSETTNFFVTLLNLRFTYGGTRPLAPRGGGGKNDCPDNKIICANYIIIVKGCCKSWGGLLLLTMSSK